MPEKTVSRGRAPRCRQRARPLITLAVLSLIWGFAVFRGGGARSSDWIGCLLALGLLMLFHWLRAPDRHLAPPIERPLQWLLGLVFALAAFQLLPLPLGLLEFLSPGRAELERALDPVAGPAGWSALSIAPAETLFQLLRGLAWIATLFLVRQVTWSLFRRAWLAAVPVIIIAGLEGALSMAQTALLPSKLGAAGTYVNHNHFAGLLELSLPFAVAAALLSLQRVHHREAGTSAPVLRACAAIVAAGLIFVGLILSFSRAGFVAAMLALMVAAVAETGCRVEHKRRVLVCSALALSMAASVFFLLPGGFVSRYAGIASWEGVLSEGRVLLWRETLDLVAAFPLTGSGLGTYESAFWRYKRSWPNITDDHAHNDYLEAVAEFGVLGFSLALCFVAAVAARLFSASREAPRNEERFLALACLASILALGLHSITDFNLAIPANAMLLAWVLGIASGLTALIEHSPLTRRILPGFIQIERGSQPRATRPSAAGSL